MKLLSRSKVYCEIVRPLNVLITIATVVVAGFIGRVEWAQNGWKLVLAALSAGMIAAGGNAYNDICDAELDRIEKSHRPLPSGRMRRVEALWEAGILFLGGWILSLWLPATNIFIAALVIAVLVLYSRYWKRQPLVGNVAVATAGGLAFLYGGVAIDQIAPTFWAAWLAFLFHLGREIIKDMEDVGGDTAMAAHTFAVVYGIQSARYLTSFILILLLLSLGLPYLKGGFGRVYLYLVLFGVVPVIGYSLVTLWRDPDRKHLHKLSVLLKYDMLFGLSALLLGRPAPGGMP